MQFIDLPTNIRNNGSRYTRFKPADGSFNDFVRKSSVLIKEARNDEVGVLARLPNRQIDLREPGVSIRFHGIYCGHDALEIGVTPNSKTPKRCYLCRGHVSQEKRYDNLIDTFVLKVDIQHGGWGNNLEQHAILLGEVRGDHAMELVEL